VRAEQAGGRVVGVGISPYVEPTGWGSEGGLQSNWSFASHDAVRLSIEPSGEVTAAVGSPSQGQGHETTLAQVVAGELGVRPEQVSVIAGDTAATPVSTSGTRASRTAVVTGGGLLLAAGDLREKLLRIAGLVLEAAPGDLEIADGEIWVGGSPDRRMAVREVAERAYFDAGLRAEEPEPDLTASRFHDPRATYSNGCIACVVEVDPETGAVAVRRLVAVEDCGTIVNPLVVDGQIAGAVVQGAGGALLEGIRYGADGRLHTYSLLAYKLPKAADLPPIEIGHCVSPSPFTPGGIKGMGESGVIATPAAVACAVEDALAGHGFEVARLPLTPETLAVA
jgi:carbon-monoxide dehydrogenase large subunit